MNSGLRIFALPLKKGNLLPCAMVALLILLFILHKPGYINIHDAYFWVGLLSLPFSFTVRKRLYSERFLWPALGFGLLSVPFTTTFGVYATLVFISLYLVEQFWGKTTLLFALHLLLLSPLFQYLSNLISFPIRLILSDMTGKILGFAGFDVQVSGNLIQFNGTDFLVDSACAGLFMLRYSFLFSVIILAYLQANGKPWRLKQIALLFAGLFCLNILGNLIRIVLLVVFRIMPAHWFHEFFGLLIFIIYMLLPFYWIAMHWSANKAVRESGTNHIKAASSARNTVTFFLCCLFAFICFKNGSKMPGSVPEGRAYAGYQLESVGDIFKLTNENALIYIKPPVEAYNANHNPLVCWRGSGYAFTHISHVTIDGLTFPVAELTRGKDKLYTVWWFESEERRTGSQWEWRWRSLTSNEDFSLVNVTAAQMDALISEAKIFMHRNGGTGTEL